MEGFVVEAGPDSFLAEKPEAAALCRELGLEDSLLGSNDSERRTYILHHGRLRPLPDGLMLLVPTRLWPLLLTPLLPLAAKFAVAAEWFKSPPSADQDTDESVASFVRRHYGNAMLENIADPLLAAVYGGDSNWLSARSVLPRFWQMERECGSLTRAVMKARRHRRAVGVGTAATEALQTGAAAPPLFMTLKEGLEVMVARLVERLDSSRVRVGQKVIGFEPAGSPRLRYRIRCSGGAAYEADAVILALPAYECSRLLAGLDPSWAEALAAIPYSSAMTVALGYDDGAAGPLPPGFGFLVPHKEKRRLLACTFVHSKFAHRAPPGKILLRCFLGGSRDPGVLELGEEEVVSIVRRELQSILHVSAEPVFYRAHRWPSAMAQYVVGHEARMKTVAEKLEKHPGLYLAGNALLGIGISDCIRAGRAAAERAVRNCGG